MPSVMMNRPPANDVRIAFTYKQTNTHTPIYIYIYIHLFIYRLFSAAQAVDL